MQFPSTTRARTVRLVAVAVVLQLSAGLLAAVVVRTPSVPPPPTPASVRAAPDQQVKRAAVPPPATVPSVAATATAQPDAARGVQVERLLQARSAALLRRDRSAFLATVDPKAVALQGRQAAMFDALAQVPLGSWEYGLDQRSGRPAEVALDQRYGRNQWWAPAVSLSYALDGFDERPSTDKQYLTFVRRDGRWLLGADDDFAAAGGVTPRALWERGQVVAVRGPGVLVLGHQDSSLLRNVATQAAAAIPRVTAVWGTRWRQRVVVFVPSSADEMASLIDSTQDLSQIAAVATAEFSGLTSADDSATDRILVNPETFPKLGQLGRRVVLTHEITHVAARGATGPLVPSWLAEGFADYIGYKDVQVPLSVAARDLRKDVRAGRLPDKLPADDAFTGNNAALAQAYEQSWLAARLLAEQYGEAGLLRFYRAVGASRGMSESAALSTALQEEFGIDIAQLTADWRAALQRQLG
ncbi:MAG: hypothetical protein ACR2K2_08530 [Mycobacteriales bacterium]